LSYYPLAGYPKKEIPPGSRDGIPKEEIECTAICSVKPFGFISY